MGPLETELQELMQTEALGSPEILEAQVEGRTHLDIEQALMVAFRWTIVLSKCISRLAREIDELRGSSAPAG